MLSICRPRFPHPISPVVLFFHSLAGGNGQDEGDLARRVRGDRPRLRREVSSLFLFPSILSCAYFVSIWWQLFQQLRPFYVVYHEMLPAAVVAKTKHRPEFTLS